MNKNAELALPKDAQSETRPTVSATEPLNTPASQIPVIEPEMARLLEFAQANDSSLTPKEINAQLDGLLLTD